MNPTPLPPKHWKLETRTVDRGWTLHSLTNLEAGECVPALPGPRTYLSNPRAVDDEPEQRRPGRDFVRSVMGPGGRVGGMVLGALGLMLILFAHLLQASLAAADSRQRFVEGGPRAMRSALACLPDCPQRAARLLAVPGYSTFDGCGGRASWWLPHHRVVAFPYVCGS
jgi:hypothetical protein